jgi:uncharacterized protein (TIGR02145 family)
MIKYFSILLIFTFFLSCTSGSNNEDVAAEQEFYSYEKALISLPNFEYKGIEYKIVKIGTQVWFAENHNSSVFSNGDTIFQAKSPIEWKNALEMKTPAWCYQSYDKNKYGYLGKMYNWYAVVDKRGLFSPGGGWHIPSMTDWDKLIIFCGGNSEANKKLKSDTGWIWRKQFDYSGTNEFGFSALPSGTIDLYGTDFHLSSDGYVLGAKWWSRTLMEQGFPRDLLNNFIDVFEINMDPRNNPHSIANGISDGLFVRCVKDEL